MHSEQADQEFPDFDDPPVVEVVLSAGFESLKAFRLVEIVQFWESRARQELPRVEEQPRYEMPIEHLGAKVQVPPVSWQVLPGPPMPRFWFLNEEGSQLLQVQNDWIARNWRRTGQHANYPRYPELKRAFASDLESLSEHLTQRQLGDLRYTQCEVTYINHIPIGAGDVRSLASVLKLAGDARSSFPEPPESQRLASSYRIHHAGQAIGRLHVTADPATRLSDSQPISVVNITARGVPAEPGIDGVLQFLDLGREWALRAFVGLTREAMHKRWRRRES